MRKPPTDRKILQLIYDRHYDNFCSYSEEEKTRASKIYLPIDCAAIAKQLNIDPDIVFGRLYYHLEKKYGYTNQDGSKVHLFALRTGSDLHAVNFPLLSAVLAEQNTNQYRFGLSVIISVAALVVSALGATFG